MSRFPILLCALTMLGACSTDMIVTIHNPSSLDRHGAIAEIDTKGLPERLKAGVAVMAGNGKQLPSQLTHDGMLLFETDIKAGETLKFRLKPSSGMEYDTICVAQIRYDFQDDLTWENDRGGYRLYGPAYKKGGGNVSGYDIWTKSVAHPVLAQRYRDHCRHGISYHKDHGNGMDAYTVGRTLGAGMNALVGKEGIIYPCAYEKCEILDNGPLRTTARITCYPIRVGDEEVVETRVISLDKGSWLNKTQVSYAGIPAKNEMATGIVVHKQNQRGYVISPDRGYAAYADLTDNPDNGNGVIYIGIVNCQLPDSITFVPISPAAGDAVGQIINHTSYTPGEDYTYYWGAGWSKGGVGGMDSWVKYLSDFRQGLLAPLQSKFEKR